MSDSPLSPPLVAVDAERFRVRPDQPVRLAEWDPRATDGFNGDKGHGKDQLDKLTKRLEELQEVLYAQRKHKLLIVLQGMDTGGKDGVIRHVFEGVNPAGVRVAGFKVPTPIELAHDYLWRVHKQTPAQGEIVIFNRSHYEDVLVVRVKGLVDQPVWSRRYAHIAAFEQMLADEGTTILKFYLHISKEEQKERLQARLDDPTKHWKFAVGDLAERARWDEYIAAYEDALNHTSTAAAPWYLVPADRKWFRNLVVSQAIVNTLEGLGLAYPEGEPGLESVVIE
jgi:PPK2 family polyphosphate:nucleotide phosphotransferase